VIVEKLFKGNTLTNGPQIVSQICSFPNSLIAFWSFLLVKGGIVSAVNIFVFALMAKGEEIV
jgi:hypothetical protein